MNEAEATQGKTEAKTAATVAVNVDADTPGPMVAAFGLPAEL
jgi:hypothetical protein